MKLTIPDLYPHCTKKFHIPVCNPNDG